MPADVKITAEILDVVEVRKAPDRMTRFVKQEMSRHMARFKKRMINERMRGAPGIKFGKGSFKVRSSRIGKNLLAFAAGRKLGTLKTVTRISRFLAVHEKGEIIKGDPYLFLQKPRGKIIAKAKRIVIRPRLGWAIKWKEMEPDLINRIDNATDRALKVSFSKNKSAGNRG